MGMLSKLLGIASIGEALSGLHLARKFVVDVAVVLLLTVIAAMVAGALAVATLFECHVLLVHHGLDPDAAAFFTLLLGVFTLALIGGVVVYKINRMQNFPFQFARGGIPGASAAHSLARGFYQGLMAGKKD